MQVYLATRCMKFTFRGSREGMTPSLLTFWGPERQCSVLVHFFEHGCWGSLVQTGGEEQSFTAQDQLFVLMQAAAYLTATRGQGSPEARSCYERAESLSHSIGRPLLMRALIGQWRHSLNTGKLSGAMQVAERLYSLAQKQDDPMLMIWAYNALAVTHLYLGDFESARQYATHGVLIWRSGGGQSDPEDVDTPVVGCFCYKGGSEWHLGEIASCHAMLDEAISVAKELKDTHALAMALGWAARQAFTERNPAEVDRFASELIELSTRHNFVYWLASGTIWRAGRAALRVTPRKVFRGSSRE